MKRNIATQDNIDATKMLILYSAEPQKIIDATCKNTQLTEAFIKEFMQYMTQENFTTSFKLSSSLVDKFPSLFSEELFLSFYNGEEESILRNNTSLSMLSRYKEKINPDENIIVNTIREATEEELTADNLGKFIAVSDTIDNLILMRAKDSDLKESLVLQAQLNTSAPITTSMFKQLSNETKEIILGTTDVNGYDFVSALAKSNDIGWVIKMINSAISGDISLQETTKNLEYETIQIISNLPEDEIVKFLQLKKYLKNAFSYNVMSYLLKEKSFSEEQLINIFDYFKSAGCYFELKKHANLNEYEKLKAIL